MTRVFAFLLGLAVSTAALAQLRSIPVEAKRGEMRHVHEVVVEMNGRTMRLAAGAQIRDPSNMIVLPASLRTRVLVKYTVDVQGDIFRVWILTPQEAAQRDRKK